jgi:hypothetical protein
MKEQTEVRRLYLPSEVAKKFRVNPKTVTRWVECGRFEIPLPSGLAAVIHTPGGHSRIDADLVDAVLSGQIILPPARRPA